MSDIKQGDTVRSTVSCIEYTVVAGPDSDDYYVVDPGDGVWGFLRSDRLTKVEPTPADRYLVIDVDGAVRWGSAYESASHAAAVARESGRVARYAFAGWVDTEAVES